MAVGCPRFPLTQDDYQEENQLGVNTMEDESRTKTEATKQARASEASSAESAQVSGAGLSATTRGAPAAKDASSAAEEALNNIITNAERSALYHKAREGFFATCHRFAMVLVLISSSSAVAVLSSDDPFYGKILALIPALVGALDIAIGFTNQARDHAILAKRFLDLAADATRSDPSVGMSDLQARFYRICGEEDATYEALNAICHNLVCDALSKPEFKTRVTRTQRFLRHLIRFSSREFPPIMRPES